ncbi:transcriptional regulator, TrmB [Methanolacinia petrolearia DSM 11571]|uniref:Transcriptional regulator, TrmB n=1 Tax=Methanolacinia petrolearia (strain DSM 11571 / OCM 486 / SEBR 4847) TaxID=679926 RepID=E1RGV6_METP4|nr:helix-turn-helix domain-containing protein [Methanolacinia petrolearia]ADN37485.1 transcriptional regulator, TrmB [Methanolacinia petrolearia DSM 11571]
MEIKKEIVETLAGIGFTEYEARAYIALIGLGNATAREVSSISGVPHGRIYSILRSLADKGYIFVGEGTPASYCAEKPFEVLNPLKTEMDRKISEAGDYLSEIQYESLPPAKMWTIRSEVGVQNRLKTLIQNAEKEIIIMSEDPKSVKRVLEDLQKVRKRVNIEIHTFNLEAFSGMKLDVHKNSHRIIEFLKNMNDYIKDDYMKNGGFRNHKAASCFYIFDRRISMVVEEENGNIIGHIIEIPELCYMIRSFLYILENNSDLVLP